MAKLENIDELKLARLESTVKNRLYEMGINVDTLKSTSLKHLIKIEDVISEKLENQSKMLESFKENKVSVLSISEESKIARQTFYNNPILKEYITYVLDNSDLVDPYKKIDALNAKLSELQEMVTQMQIRDVNLEILYQEKENLKDELNQKKKEITQLRKQNQEISARITDYKKQLGLLNNNTSKVIEFSPNY